MNIGELCSRSRQHRKQIGLIFCSSDKRRGKRAIFEKPVDENSVGASGDVNALDTAGLTVQWIY